LAAILHGREPDTNQGQRSANPRTMSTDG
jgi:hypothetical protein